MDGSLYLDQRTDLEKLADLFLGINSRRGNKKDDEYPILSNRQLERRRAKEAPFGPGIEFIGLDGRIYDMTHD